MLDFYFIDPKLDLPYYGAEGIRVGGLRLDDAKWLHQHNLVKPFSNETYNEHEMESIPFFSDFQLTLEEIQRMLEK